jgi:DNA replication protein DnaC
MNKNFHGYEPLKKLYDDYVSDLNKSFTSGTSYCLAGSHGVAKTMQTCCVLKKASLKGYKCLYTTLSDVVNVLTGAPYEERFKARRELFMVDFLVVDEFDNRFMPSENAADLYARTLETVFRTRIQNRIPTLMCTNSPNIVATFNGNLKSSIESLFKYVKVFPVLGEDYRGK